MVEAHQAGAQVTAVLLCSLFPSSFIFMNIVLLLHKNVKVLGARSGIFLVFISLPSVVFGTSGLNKYTGGHTSLLLSFQMEKPGLVK